MPATTTVSANGDDTTENLNVQPKMVRRIANFVAASNSRHMDAETTGLMKRNILDSVACAISALGGDLVPAFRGQFAEYRSSELCTLIGGGRHPRLTPPGVGPKSTSFGPRLLYTGRNPTGLMNLMGEQRRDCGRRLGSRPPNHLSPNFG